MSRYITNDWPWGSIPEQDVVVDIGKLEITQSIILATKFGNLHFNLQDKQQSIDAAKQAWNSVFKPEEVAKRVQFRVIQPSLDDVMKVDNAAVFLLYSTVSEWETMPRIQLFARLLSFAKATTVLLVYIGMGESPEDLQNAMRSAGWTVKNNNNRPQASPTQGLSEGIVPIPSLQGPFVGVP